MLPPATWYPDPSGRHEHRYWDGARWTEHVADAGIAAIDHLPTVTADEQVDGGVAADIAAVAMAATSTAEESDRGDAGDRRDRRRRRTERATDGTTERRDVDGTEGDSVDDEDDPWRDAASTWFVMPPETIASLADRAASSPAVPTFTGLDVDGTDIGAAHGVARAGDGITALVAPDGDGVLAATRWIRRIVGTCDLEPVTPAWARRVVGDGTLTLIPDGASTLVAPLGVARATVRSDAFVAAPASARVTPCRPTPVVGDALDVADAAWLALTAPEGASLVAVDGHRRLPAARVVAWTDGVECVAEEGGVVLVRGSGSVLLDGQLGD